MWGGGTIYKHGGLRVILTMQKNMFLLDIDIFSVSLYDCSFDLIIIIIFYKFICLKSFGTRSNPINLGNTMICEK